MLRVTAWLEAVLTSLPPWADGCHVKSWFRLVAEQALAMIAVLAEGVSTDPLTVPCT